MTAMPDHRICAVRERDLVALEHLLRDSPDVQMSLKSLELKEVQPPTHLSSGFNPTPAVALVRSLKTLSSKTTGLNEIIVNGAKHQNPDLSDSLQLMLNRRRAPQAAFQHWI